MSTLGDFARYGRVSAGYAREPYLECPDDKGKWVTEIQKPVVRA
ncbi:hypothetical protein [Streptomyces noursei]|nr:hypothetical protein [Streptomyces noursei]